VLDCNTNSVLKSLQANFINRYLVDIEFLTYCN
jgi:hypothetical protein